MVFFYFMVAFCVSMISAPFWKRLAMQFNIIDYPNDRKIHLSNIPKLGGLSFITPFLLFFIISGNYDYNVMLYLSANIIIILTGLSDDIKTLSPLLKFLGQGIAAFIIIFYLDIKNFSAYSEYSIISNILDIIFTFIWIIGITNAVNLIDGLDGLAGTASFMILGALALLSFAHGGQSLYLYIIVTLMGSVLGFLKNNIPPASIFMGDAGSLFLGFNMAVMSIAVFQHYEFSATLIMPFSLMALPVFDTGMAIFRRVRRGESPLMPDKKHLHHRLLSLGYETKNALIILMSLLLFLNVIFLWTSKDYHILGFFIIYISLFIFMLVISSEKKYRCIEKIFFSNKNLIKEMDIADKKRRLSLSQELWFRINCLFFIILNICLFLFSFEGLYLVGLPSLVIFLVSFIFIFCYQRENNFMLFSFFWIFFYVSFCIVSMGNKIALSLCLILFLSYLFSKILNSNKVKSIIDNPMEIIILYSLIFLYFILKMDFYMYVLVIANSTTLYLTMKIYINDGVVVYNKSER